MPVTVDVGSGHRHPTAKRGIIGEEALQQGAGAAIEDLGVRLGATARTGDDVRVAVEVDVAAANVDSPPEVAVSEETHQHLAGAAVEHLDVRLRAQARAGDDVRETVGVDVAAADVDAAREGRVVGEETLQQLAGAAV